MKKLSQLLDFSTDIALSFFLLFIFGFGFVLAVSLTPLSIDSNSIIASDSNSVLGASTVSANIFSPVTGQGDYVNTSVVSDSESSLVLNIDVDKDSPIVTEFPVAVISASQSEALTVFAELDIPSDYKKSIKYTLVVEGNEYVVYDDNSSKLHRDFELNVVAGASTEVVLKIESYSGRNYGLDLALKLTKKPSQLP